MSYVISLFVAGAIGAFVKDVLVGNEIRLPERIDRTLSLGFIGGMIIGGFVGWVVDGTLLTAALAGFVGFATIENLIPKKVNEEKVK